MVQKQNIKRFGAILICLILLLGIMSCQDDKTESSETTEQTVLINGLLIDGNGGVPLEDAVVIIEENRITAVGSSMEVEIPENAKIINLEGSSLMPGFINTHGHYLYDPELLKAFAQDGVTTIRDMQDSNPQRMENWSWFEKRDELQEDPYNSRLLAVGPMVTVPDGYPLMGDPNEQALVVTSVQDAEEKTLRLIEAGADNIKIAIEQGTAYMMPSPLPTLSTEEAKAITHAAHQRGIKVTAHITHSEDIPAFLEAGCDEIAHMVLDEELTDDLIQQLVEADISWGPTLELWSLVETLPFVLDANPEYQSFEPAVKNLKKFVEAGGRVVLGTDFGGLSGGATEMFQTGMPMIEINGMLKAGMTPMEVITAATKDAAFVCGKEDMLGTIETGMTADILVVDGNPLEDISALENPVMVIRDGIVIRNSL